MSSMGRPLAAAVLLAFASGLISVVVTPHCTQDRVEDPQAFVRAAQSMRDVVVPGDTVLVHPPWRHDVVRALNQPGVLPAGTQATLALGRRHGEPWPDLVLIADDALPLPRALEEHLHAAAPAHTRVVEGVRVVRLGSGPLTGVVDLAHFLAQARVEVRKPSASGPVVTPCPWDSARQRHVCAGLPEWMTVGLDTFTIGGRSERCVWAHPISHGEVVIAFPPQRLHDMLVLELAFTDGASDNPALAGVTAELRANGGLLGELVRPPGQRGFVQGAFTPPHSPTSVEVVLRTPNDAQRHTCFRLSARPSDRPSGPQP